MDKRKKRRRALELCKDGLIVALACSALWLAARIYPLEKRGETEQTAGPVQSQEGARADAARPLRLVINQAGTSGGTARWGVQYDTIQSDALFQQVASLLAEALSSAGEPEEITRRDWEEALQAAPGVTFDFQGEIPVSVLIGWLSGEVTARDAVVRRMVLAVQEDQAALYYRDEATGLYYRCLSSAVSRRSLSDALGPLGENGALYAFEGEEYRVLDPDTLISRETPEPRVYTVVNPVSGGQSDLEALMGDLGLPVDNSSFYPSVDGQVARVGSDTLRLYENGVVEYQSGEEGERFHASVRGETASLFESVELCRQVAAATLGSRCGEARFYLSSALETPEGLEVRFQYCLNGSTVLLEKGDAARFLVQDGSIRQFWLNLRSYADSGKTSVVMPVVQAMAAMDARGQEGRELLLMYTDAGGDTSVASWVAVDGTQGRE